MFLFLVNVIIMLVNDSKSVILGQVTGLKIIYLDALKSKMWGYNWKKFNFNSFGRYRQGMKQPVYFLLVIF